MHRRERVNKVAKGAGLDDQDTLAGAQVREGSGHGKNKNAFLRWHGYDTEARMNFPVKIGAKELLSSTARGAEPRFVRLILRRPGAWRSQFDGPDEQD